MKHFTSVNDVTDIHGLVSKALALKANPYSQSTLGKNKTIGLIFFNPSLRTRLSTQKAAQSLGMSVMMFNIGEEGWKIETEDGVVMDQDKQEHIKDAVGVMGQYCDIIGVRSFPKFQNREEDYQDAVIEQFKEYAGVPIVSLESAIRHPLQSLADLITITELNLKKPKIVLTWAPHPRALPQAVSNSFSEWVLGAGYDLTITHPKGYELNQDFTKGASIVHDQKEAFEGADIIYAKNWSSYQDYGKIIDNSLDWVVNEEKMKLTNQGKFMHCLPVRRNVVVSDGVLDGNQTAHLQQAGNREFSAQVVLQELLKANY